MLTQTLRELEEDGLVNRKAHAVVLPKVEYSLTYTGKELIPFIDHVIGVWAEKQIKKKNIKLAKDQ